MNTETTWAIYDELYKIADDLMNPSVVANSAAVDGPPAKPFTRRRGYRRLATQIDKEAGAFKDALRMLRSRAKLVQHHTTKGIKAVDDAVRDASIRAYIHAPEPVKKVVHGTEKVLTDPDNTGSAAIGEALKRLAGH